MKNTVKNKITINKLFTEGKRVITKNLILRIINGNDNYMVTVPSKTFKRAVDRNRIKRLMRESIRTVNIKGTYVLIYLGKDIPTLDVLKNEINEIVRKIGG